MERLPVAVRQLRELYLKVSVGLGGDGVQSRVDKIGLDSVHNVLRDKHHARERLTDDAVKGDEDGERNEGPQTAGHGVGAVLLVELLHLLVELLGVPLVSALDLLDLGLKTGGAHHALLALRHERGQNEVDDESEEYDGHTVIAGQLIELDHEPRKGLSNCCPHSFSLMCL